MQKVVYSISKVNKDEKLKGVGYLVEGNLLIPSTTSKGNAYIRVFEDVTEKCKAVANSDNEFKGYVTVAYENIHVFNKEKNHYDTLDYSALDLVTLFFPIPFFSFIVYQIIKSVKFKKALKRYEFTSREKLNELDKKGKDIRLAAQKIVDAA